jgi:hypothetical protein
MKFITKTTLFGGFTGVKTMLLGGFTGAVLYGVFILIALLFHEIAFWVSVFPMYSLVCESYNSGRDVAMFVLVWIPYVPGLVFGMLAGFFYSLFWDFVPEHKRKESVLFSSLKHRTRSFLSYCLFLGESTLCVVALESLFLCAMGIVFSPEKSVKILNAIGYPEYFSENILKTLVSNNSDDFIKLIAAVFLAIASVLIIWKCEAYIAKEKQSAAQALPAEQQQKSTIVVLVMSFGILLLAAMALYMLPLLLLGLIMVIMVPIGIFWLLAG